MPTSTAVRIIGAFALIVVSLTGLEFLRSNSNEGQLLLSQNSYSCSAPVGSADVCQRCYQSFCPSFPLDRVKTLCGSFCNNPLPPPPSPPSSSSKPAVLPPSPIFPVYSCLTRHVARGMCQLCLNSLCIFKGNNADAVCSRFCVPNSSSSSLSSASAVSSSIPAPSSSSATSLPASSSQGPITYSVEQFGANLQDTEFDDSAFSLCLAYAMRDGSVCRIGVGQLTLSKYAQELRKGSGTNIDAKGMTLEGTGDTTIIKGISDKGFDILQLNRISNMNIRNLRLVAQKTTGDSTHGVNGISMTNGTSHITIENVTVEDLPYVVKQDYIDGGKAFTVQTGQNPLQSSTKISIQNSRSIRNPTGFGIDSDPNTTTPPGTLTFSNNTIEDALIGVSLSFLPKRIGGTDVPGFSMDVANNDFVNVRHPLFVGRAPSVRFVHNRIRVTSDAPIITPPTFIHRSFPFVLLGASNGVFTNNAIDYAIGSGSLFLIGGTSIGAYTENFTFQDNTISAPTRSGIRMQNSGGIGTRLSVMGCNTVKRISGLLYDSAFSLAVFKNTVLSECNKPTEGI